MFSESVIHLLDCDTFLNVAYCIQKVSSKSKRIREQFGRSIIFVTSKLKQQDAAVLCDAIHIHTVCKMRVVLF